MGYFLKLEEWLKEILSLGIFNSYEIGRREYLLGLLFFLLLNSYRVTLFDSEEFFVLIVLLLKLISIPIFYIILLKRLRKVFSKYIQISEFNFLGFRALSVKSIKIPIATIPGIILLSFLGVFAIWIIAFFPYIFFFCEEWSYVPLTSFLTNIFDYGFKRSINALGFLMSSLIILQLLSIGFMTYLGICKGRK
tara:strand:+ start:106 stop:684 length:579 start_codon:yes stop_codon:yes gene_type:complete